MPFVRTRHALALAAVLAPTSWGCSSGTPAVDTTLSEAKVTGKVTVRGKPMKGGEISFNPSNYKRQDTVARKVPIKNDGSYEITTLEGRNAVSFSGPAVTKEPQLAYGIITYDVKAGTNTFDIELPPE